MADMVMNLGIYLYRLQAFKVGRTKGIGIGIRERLGPFLAKTAPSNMFRPTSPPGHKASIRVAETTQSTPYPSPGEYP